MLQLQADHSQHGARNLDILNAMWRKLRLAL